MNDYKQHILLCEEDTNLAAVVAEYLRSEGFIVDQAANGNEGWELIQSAGYDLCITDAAMPEKDGISLLHDLRAGGIKLPVILVWEREDKDDILEGYHQGGDDYVTKPYSMDILICKIHAILRRLQQADDNQDSVFQIGEVTFDSDRQLLGDQRLSTRENDLLLMLCRKPNHLVERGHILKALWQVDNYFSTRSLAVYINHLRHKLHDIPNAKIIAVHGKGYKLLIDEL